MIEFQTLTDREFVQLNRDVLPERASERIEELAFEGAAVEEDREYLGASDASCSSRLSMRFSSAIGIIRRRWLPESMSFSATALKYSTSTSPREREPARTRFRVTGGLILSGNRWLLGNPNGSIVPYNDLRYGHRHAIDFVYGPHTRSPADSRPATHPAGDLDRRSREALPGAGRVRWTRHFRGCDRPLLANYCEALVLSTQSHAELAAHGPVDGAARCRLWLRVHAEATKSVAALSARLRLCPQSRYDRLKAGLTTREPAPPAVTRTTSPTVSPRVLRRLWPCSHAQQISLRHLAACDAITSAKTTGSHESERHHRSLHGHDEHHPGGGAGLRAEVASRLAPRLRPEDLAVLALLPKIGRSYGTVLTFTIADLWRHADRDPALMELRAIFGELNTRTVERTGLMFRRLVGCSRDGYRLKRVVLYGKARFTASSESDAGPSAAEPAVLVVASGSWRPIHSMKNDACIDISRPDARRSRRGTRTRLQLSRRAAQQLAIVLRDTLVHRRPCSSAALS